MDELKPALEKDSPVKWQAIFWNNLHAALLAFFTSAAVALFIQAIFYIGEPLPVIITILAVGINGFFLLGTLAIGSHLRKLRYSGILELDNHYAPIFMPSHVFKDWTQAIIIKKKCLMLAPQTISTAIEQTLNKERTVTHVAQLFVDPQSGALTPRLIHSCKDKKCVNEAHFKAPKSS